MLTRMIASVPARFIDAVAWGGAGIMAGLGMGHGACWWW